MEFSSHKKIEYASIEVSESLFSSFFVISVYVEIDWLDVKIEKESEKFQTNF